MKPFVGVVSSISNMEHLPDMDSLLKRADLSPHAIKKIFEDLGQSPEKFRALMNLWFVPMFRPTFVDDQDPSLVEIQDVQLFSSSESRPSQSPFRMFDIETGNLVEFPAIGALGQYCMLSHRWKGAEVTLSDIVRARSKDSKRAKKAFLDAAGSIQDVSEKLVQKTDVERVLEQTVLDIEDQQATLLQLLALDGRKMTVGESIRRRLRAKSALQDLARAQSSLDAAVSKLRFAFLERQIFGTLIDQTRDSMDEKAPKGISQSTRDHTTLDEVVGDAEASLKDAESKLQLEKARAEQQEMHADIQYFASNSRVREAVDEMIRRLEKWKSAIKISQSILQARSIFKEKLFQEREKSYIWLDTCCIDKKNGGELSESLALMGDWYEQAAFVLVQLEDKFDEANAVHDWSQFETYRRQGSQYVYQADPQKQLIHDFGDIKEKKPEWSERGWTMQELVMSKTTFFINEEWSPLDRLVDTLGVFYHLIPYIELYTRVDTANPYIATTAADVTQGRYDLSSLRDVLETNEPPSCRLNDLVGRVEAQSVHLSPDKSLDAQRCISEEADRVKNALTLTTILQCLCLQFPPDMSEESAKSEMVQAVFLATNQLVQDSDDSGRRRLLEDVASRLYTITGSAFDRDEMLGERKAQHVINLLLRLLVVETVDLIRDDRRYIAEFSHVTQLQSWIQGTERTGFSTQQVMALSSKRRTTVATDHVYALMGVLAVRFPTFHAEGPTKALSRLLDEIVIAHNDVSVFNWTGVDMGSTIRGRSMYPSSHKAFADNKDRGLRFNLLLSQAVQSRMNEIMDTFHAIVTVLREAIEFVRDQDTSLYSQDRIQEIGLVIQHMSLQSLKPNFASLAKLIKFCLKLQRTPSLPSLGSSPSSPPSEKGVEGTASGFSDSPILSMPFRVASSGLSSMKDMTGVKLPGISGISGISGFSQGFRQPLRGKKAEPQVKRSQGEKGPIGPSLSAATTMTNIPAETAWAPAALSEIHDPEVESYVKSLVDAVLKKQHTTDIFQRLPSKVQDMEFSAPQRSTFVPKKSHSHDARRMTSPNPIIVNNSGIEGIFDIQRVIVSMINPDKLQRQIAQAVSPHQKISGWCSVSTGFARVIVNFACESSILAKQMDVVQAVESKILREQDREQGKKRGSAISQGLSVFRLSHGPKMGADKDKDESSLAKSVDNETTPQRKQNDDNGDDDDDSRMVSRMIHFIQEPNLQLVAGEWVLARFSGVPGAHWFLCQLELGSTHQFYGHRIATSDIDFGGSTPEAGLVNVWSTYMARKKRKMCNILKVYLESKRNAAEKKRKADEITELAKRGIMLDFDTKPQKLSSPTSPKALVDETELYSDDDGGEDDSDSDSGGDGDGEAKEVSKVGGVSSLAGNVFSTGKAAVEAVGNLALFSVQEKWLQMRADRLDHRLNRSALKYIMKELQPAVENLSDNRDFLPAMFHAAQRVHMF